MAGMPFGGLIVTHSVRQTDFARVIKLYPLYLILKNSNMFKPISALALTCLLFFSSISLKADIRLPAVISSNMVLQQDDSVKIWGWATPTEKISITPSWSNHTYSTVATADARWEIRVKTPKAGGPYSIDLKGQNTIRLENVMIGEVWICSGQSNMEWSYRNGVPQIKEEFPVAGNLNIRFFQVPKTTSEYPQDDCNAQWVECDSNTLRAFSAIGYFFGKQLSQDLGNIPVGLINASWGGTPAEVWAPIEVVREHGDLEKAAANRKSAPWWTTKPAFAYNGMIAPLTPFTLRGAIWYQGESNVTAASTYTKLFTEMITHWRQRWNREIPFYYVQIAPFAYGNKDQRADLLREAQEKSLQLAGTGMVVISDLVDDINNIHPVNKRDVGIRLANMALARTYDQDIKSYQSPLFQSLEVEKNRAVVSFDYAPNGLAINGKKIAALSIAGSDRVFHPAEAKIKNNKLIVSAKEVKQPVAVRYQFTNEGIGNLTSKEGLPVAPFRTDNWNDNGEYAGPWKQLFNGKDLKDWKVKIRGHELNDNYANTFRVEDGKMVVRYNPDSPFDKMYGHIFYKTPFSHYLLGVEYRFVGQQAKDGEGWAYKNSGIMLHCQAPETMKKDQDFPISIEVQLLGGDATGERTTCNLCTPGTNVVMDGKLVTNHCINSSSKTFRGEEWVRAEVLVLGDSVIKHIVNGDTVLVYEQPQIGGGAVSDFDPAVKIDGKLLSSGYISLQSESHPVEFRKVEIMEIKQQE